MKILNTILYKDTPDNYTVFPIHDSGVADAKWVK